MKKYLLLFLGGSILSFNSSFAQQEPVVPPQYGMPLMVKDTGDYVWVKATNSLPKFDLDFSGGTPKDLVKAIEKVTGKPLNTIIPNDCADLKLPALSVKNITVAQLFDTLILASKNTKRYDVIDPLTGNGSFSDHTGTYGFQTDGVPNENSIWFFYWDTDPGPDTVIAPKVCKFYQLSPYLEGGYKIEDIMTAVQTAWKMLGVTKPPEITYHKDTKILIAVGDADKVNLIGDVLKQLSTKPKEKSNDKGSDKSNQ